MLPIESAFKVFTDRNGKPLENGYVYFGTPNQNPITSPITVYWDAAGTQPAAQPLRTVNGYIVRSGTPANVFVDVAYSQLVQDNKRRQVFYARTSDEFSIAAIVIAFLASIAGGGGAGLIGFLQTGVGAILRTLLDKVQENITTFDFMTTAQKADVRAKTYLLDVTAAVNAAAVAATGRELVVKEGGYKCSSGLTFFGTVRGDGATFKFTAGAPVANLVTTAVEGDHTGYTIDGSGVASCQNGLFVDTDFVQTGTCYYDLKIKNISNSNNTQGCNGALFFKASGAAVNLKSKLDIKIDVDGVTATANTIIGDTGGSSTGIFVSFNGSGTDSMVKIHDSVVQNILPAEDSGGIQLFVGDHTVSTALGNYLVEDCKIINSKKRGVKVQAQNSIVSRVVVYGQTTEVGYDSYAINTVFQDCKYILGGSTAFRTQGAATVFSRCLGSASTQQPLLRLEGGATNPLVRDSSFINTAALSGVANNLVLISGVANSIFENVGVAGTTNTGSAFSISGTCDVRFRGGTIQGTEYGVFLGFSSGSFSFSEGAAMNVLTFGFFRTGASAQAVVCNDATVNALIGFNLVSGGAAATVDLNNCKIGTTQSGVLASAGSRVVDCVFTNPGVAGTAISAGNSIARGNRINGYAVGISYTFTTTAEVANNVTVGCTLPYETTGFVAFVNNDNFSR